METAKNQTSRPWQEHGCTFRIMPTGERFELQRLAPSGVLNACTFWKYVKEFDTLDEVSDYIDDLFNSSLKITMEAKSAFLAVDAFKYYVNNALLTSDEKDDLEHLICLINNNISNPEY